MVVIGANYVNLNSITSNDCTTKSSVKSQSDDDVLLLGDINNVSNL